MFSSTYNLAMPDQVIGCAALLLAAAILRLSPNWVRWAFFIVVLGCGVLAITGGLATSLADAAVARLFE
jgi:hypothetical protein